jgi:hypothetical protein
MEALRLCDSRLRHPRRTIQSTHYPEDNLGVLASVVGNSFWKTFTWGDLPPTQLVSRDEQATAHS